MSCTIDVPTFSQILSFMKGKLVTKDEVIAEYNKFEKNRSKRTRIPGHVLCEVASKLLRCNCKKQVNVASLVSIDEKKGEMILHGSVRGENDMYEVRVVRNKALLNPWNCDCTCDSKVNGLFVGSRKLPICRLTEKTKARILKGLQEYMVDLRIEGRSGDESMCKSLSVSVLQSLCTKDGWYIDDFLGQGAYGAVLSVYRRKKNGMERAAAKIVLEWEDEKDVLDEIKFQKKMHKLNLAPGVITFRHMKRRNDYQYYVIIMEKIETVADKFLARPFLETKHLQNFVMAFYELLLKLKKANLNHNDMHSENVAIVRNKKTNKPMLVLIDFGLSEEGEPDIYKSCKQLYDFLFFDEDRGCYKVNATLLERKEVIRGYLGRVLKEFGIHHEVSPVRAFRRCASTG